MSTESNNINIGLITEKLQTKGAVLVLMGQQLTMDSVASSLAIYGWLKDQGQEVLIAAPTQMRAEFSRLIGVDAVSPSISNRDLVIGFQDYDFSSIERVSHNDGAQGMFELIIQPKMGRKAPSSNNVSFSYRGANADLIFMVGLNRLEDLGDMYEQERTLFQKALTVAINRRPNTTFASISIIDEKANSLAEITLGLLQQLGGEIKADTATNLLAGLDFATNRFQNPMVTADAFKSAALLLELGGKRLPSRPNQFDNGGFMPFVPSSNVNQPPLPGAEFGQPTLPPQSLNPQNPPDDWLKPKIFTGTSKV